MRGREKVMVYRAYESLEDELENVAMRQQVGVASAGDMDRLRRLEDQVDGARRIMDSLNLYKEYLIWQKNKDNDEYLRNHGLIKQGDDSYDEPESEQW